MTPPTPTPFEQATHAAAAELHARLLATHWPPEVAEPLARIAAEISVEQAWPIFKHSISAWQRERTEETSP